MCDSMNYPISHKKFHMLQQASLGRQSTKGEHVQDVLDLLHINCAVDVACHTHCIDQKHAE
jgi:hypothetical protein